MLFFYDGSIEFVFVSFIFGVPCAAHAVRTDLSGFRGGDWDLARLLLATTKFEGPKTGKSRNSCSLRGGYVGAW